MGYLRTVFFKLKFQKFGSKSLSVQVSLAGVLRNVNKKTVHQLVFLTHTSSPFHTGHRRCCDVFLRKLMGSKSPNGRLKNPGMQIADTFFFFFGGVQCLNFDQLWQSFPTQSSAILRGLTTLS